MKKLSIVIVNWNSGGLLTRCLESLRQHSGESLCQVVVVDNASTDASADLGSSSDGWSTVVVEVVRNSENLGFAKGVNLGLARCEGDLILLLNPDATVKAGALDALVAAVLADSGVGAAVPRLVTAEGLIQPNVWPNPPTAMQILIDGLRLEWLLPRKFRGEWLLGRHWDYARRRYVNSFSGAAVMVRRVLVEDVGGLDERFWMYGEDAEWCTRIVRRGWRIVFEPAAEIVHHGAGSAKTRWTEGERHLREVAGLLAFQRRCLPTGQAMVIVSAQAVVLAAVCVKTLLLRRDSSVVRSSLRLHLACWRELLAARFSRV